MRTLRRLVAPLALILAVGSLTACVAYSEPAPAYYSGGYYYGGPSVVVHEGGYYHRHW